MRKALFAALVASSLFSTDALATSEVCQQILDQWAAQTTKSRDFRNRRGDILNKASFNAEGAEALRPLWRQEAARLTVEALKRNGIQSIRANDIRWSEEVRDQDPSSAIPLSYIRLTGQGRYSKGNRLYDRRIFDGIYQAWLAIHAAAAAEDIQIVMRFLNGKGVWPVEYRLLLQNECIAAVAKAADEKGIPRKKIGTVRSAKILGIAVNKLFYSAQRIFDSKDDFYRRLESYHSGI